MKTTISVLTALALTAFTAAPVMAACPDTTAAAGTKDQKGISKDGTHAPLEDSANSQTTTTGASTGTTTTSAEAAGTAPKKDGTTMPMAADKNQATSDQDAQAQQKGDKTAAAKGADSKDCVE